MRPSFFFSLGVFVVACWAQTLTTTDDDGNTVVEVMTLDHLGDATTETVETLTGALTGDGAATTALTAATTSTTSSTTTSTTATTVAQGGGIVGQPVTDTESETLYTYTTTVDGVKTAVLATFTPTFPPTLTPSIGASGTGPMGISEYLSIYGTSTAAATSSASPPLRRNMALLTAVCSVLGGILVAL